ncbi:MAG: AraC family transcriptional regulator [Bacillota bacterium]|nr:AraC family transcriptional regulator [Bacillota bacterium]
MLTDKECIEKLYKYTECETRFKALYHSNPNIDIFADFNNDFELLFFGALQTKNFAASDEWFSSIANYHYPRRMSAKDNYIRVSKHDRYILPFLHNHAYYEMIYVLNGECTQTIDIKTVTMHKDDLCIISPETVHSIYTFCEDSIVINIMVSTDIIKFISSYLYTETSGISDYLSDNVSGCNSLKYILFSSCHDSIHKSVFEACRAFFENDENLQLQYKVLVVDILSSLVQGKYKDYSIGTDKTSGDKLVLSILEYIRKNLYTLTLDELSEKFHYNSQYLSRLIKKKTGNNFKTIISQMKIFEASKLLTFTDKTVEEIANLTGYNSAEHFIRSFRQYMHSTPTSFRKSQKTSISK